MYSLLQAIRQDCMYSLLQAILAILVAEVEYIPASEFVERENPDLQCHQRQKWRKLSNNSQSNMCMQ